MKQSIRVLFVAAALASISGVASAGGDHFRRAECRAAHDAKFLPTYDANRDGMLDRAERQKLRQDRRAQALARYDVDRDGRLDDAEWSKLRQGRVAQRFAQLDVNRDGGISRQEAAGPCSRLARHFDKVDFDHDGQISAAELGAARLFGKRGKFHGRHMQGDQERPDRPDEEPDSTDNP
jgi:hypothetical protein